MKTLLVLRHAKSSRGDTSLPDFDRPLNDRGRDDAELMGRHLRKHQLRVDAVISSPATRARRTAELFLKAGNISLVASFDERIYEASLQRLLTVVSEIESSHEAALLIGHNPGFEELVESLTGQSVRMPTAALAEVALNIDRWRDARPGTARLVTLTTPKKLKN